MEFPTEILIEKKSPKVYVFSSKNMFFTDLTIEIVNLAAAW